MTHKILPALAFISVVGLAGACEDADPVDAESSDMTDFCDPTLVCDQVITCVNEMEYPTSCGPDNCDPPLGACPTYCGGEYGDPCSETEFCDYEEGCAGDEAVPGICSPRSSSCPVGYDPHCGCDGKTYATDCLAYQAGVDVRHWGECEDR